MLYVVTNNSPHPPPPGSDSLQPTSVSMNADYSQYLIRVESYNTCHMVFGLFHGAVLGFTHIVACVRITFLLRITHTM